MAPDARAALTPLRLSCSFLQQLKSSYDMALAAGFDAFTTEDFYETVEELFKRLESESSVRPALCSARFPCVAGPRVVLVALFLHSPCLLSSRSLRFAKRLTTTASPTMW